MLDYFESTVDSALGHAYDACEASSGLAHCESFLEMLRRHTAKFEKLSESWQPPMKTTSGGAEILFPNWDVPRSAGISSPNRLQSKRLPEREILEQRIADKQSKAEKARVARESQVLLKAQERETRIKEASNRVTQKLDRVRCSTESRHGKAVQVCLSALISPSFLFSQFYLSLSLSLSLYFFFLSSFLSLFLSYLLSSRSFSFFLFSLQRQTHR